MFELIIAIVVGLIGLAVPEITMRILPLRWRWQYALRIAVVQALFLGIILAAVVVLIIIGTQEMVADITS